MTLSQSTGDFLDAKLFEILFWVIEQNVSLYSKKENKYVYNKVWKVFPF